MNSREKKIWLLIIYSVILHSSLSYIKWLLLYLNIDFAYKFSPLIFYGGIVLLIISLVIMYYLKKKYETPNKVILRDNQVRIHFVVMIILGIGVCLM